MDKGFFSTTLSKDTVQNRDYANLAQRNLFTIYVPKWTHCVYIDLVSNMHKNENFFASEIKLKVIGKCMFGKFIKRFEC